MAGWPQDASESLEKRKSPPLAIALQNCDIKAPLQPDSSCLIPPPLQPPRIPLCSVLLDSPITRSLSPALSIQQIQCCLDKMHLIFKQFRKARLRPGEPRAEPSMLSLVLMLSLPLPLPSFLPASGPVPVLFLPGLLLGAHWSSRARVRLVQGWVPGSLATSCLQTSKRQDACTPD